MEYHVAALQSVPGHFERREPVVSPQYFEGGFELGPQNRGKWWCQGESKTYKVEHYRHGNTSISSCGHCAARMEVSNGPDRHFDLIGHTLVHTDHNRVCVEADYDPWTLQWKASVWTAKDSC